MDRWQQRAALQRDRRPVVVGTRALPRSSDGLTHGLRLALHTVLRGLLRSYHRFRVTGSENLPADRSFVIVCNHTSHLDALCLLSSLPLRQVGTAYPAAAADYFFSSIPRAFFSSLLINGLPFDRNGGGGESLALCRELLAGPRNVLILFPEGTRSLSGEIQRFRAGVGQLVVGTPIPVVPCYLVGAYAAWPKGALFPKPGRLELRIGPPLSFEAFEAGRPGTVRRACLRLQRAVESLAPDPRVELPRRTPPLRRPRRMNRSLRGI